MRPYRMSHRLVAPHVRVCEKMPQNACSRARLRKTLLYLQCVTEPRPPGSVTPVDFFTDPSARGTNQAVPLVGRSQRKGGATMRWDFWRRKRRETDLEDEIAYDLALDVEERIRSGSTPREAELAARRDFGNVGLLKEGIREMWGWTSLERLGRDIRYGWRSLRNSPLFAAMAVLSLALGIGANASIFSVINAIFLRPLPGVERPSELVSLNGKMGSRGNTVPLVSYPNYRDFRDRNSVLTGLAGIGFIPASVGPKGNCQRMWGLTVTGNYFDLLGVKPLAGRLLQPEDDKVRGGHPVMVLSYTGWQRFGGDPSIVGAKLQVNGRDFTVLGVTPKGFVGTELFFAPDAFFSIAMYQELRSEGADLDSR